MVPCRPPVALRPRPAMKARRESPSTTSRFRVRTASVQSQAKTSRGYEPYGKPFSHPAWMPREKSPLRRPHSLTSPGSECGSVAKTIIRAVNASSPASTVGTLWTFAAVPSKRKAAAEGIGRAIGAGEADRESTRQRVTRSSGEGCTGTRHKNPYVASRQPVEPLRSADGSSRPPSRRSVLQQKHARPFGNECVAKGFGMERSRLIHIM